MQNSHSTQNHTRYIGIDVAASSCVAAIDGAKPRKFLIDARDVARLACWSKELIPEANILAAMEHTGVYSPDWARLLLEHGIGSTLVDPKRVKSFAKALGIRNKTDRADAVAILKYAQHFQPAGRVPPTQAECELAALVQQRATFVRMRATMATQGKSQDRQPGIPALLEPERSVMLTALNDTVQSLESRIKDQIQAEPKLRRAAEILKSMPGMGPVNIAQFCIHLKVIMDCNAKQLTALIGFSPKHKQSGTSVYGRSRIDKQGWAEMRKNLYLAANCAAQHCPVFAEFKQRLVDKGKPPRLAVVAVARKMLVIAHSLLHKDEMFTPNYQHA